MAQQITPLPACCYFVGAGPGDPRLVTVRGLDLLRRADVVLYDSLVNPLLLLECRRDALIEHVGKRFGCESTPQEKINSRLLELLRLGKSVVRLKGGDPLTFARGGEEMQAVAAAGYEFEVVPGVSALNGCTAYAGIPLTHRDCNSEFHAFTATREFSDQDFSHLAHLGGVRVLFMGVSQLKKCCDQMLANCADPTTKVAIIEWGTRGRQRCVTGDLSTISQTAMERKIVQPAIIVIGENVALRSSLAWWEKKPLHGKKILLTTSVTESSRSTAERLIERGAELNWTPLINVSPVEEITGWQNFAELHRLPGTTVLFTSANAVDFYLRFLLSQNYDVRLLAGNRIISCGVPACDRLQKSGLRPDRTYPAGRLEDVAQELATYAGDIIWPCGSESREQWLPGLENRLHKLEVYSTGTRMLSQRERESLLEKWDYIIFMSPSAAKAWFDNQLPSELSRYTVAVGKRTAEALGKYGFQDIIIPAEASTDALLKRLEHHCEYISLCK